MSGSTVIIINETRRAVLTDSENNRVDELVEELKGLGVEIGEADVASDDDSNDG